ncbi:hypothetical protein CPC08DRAFT_303641 [Agrocybe pediades]|nr:hypothetical protein CPC08DRAFT_303641 [Agrocybe pediades]
MTLLFEDIPDDVWIDIFEFVEEPAQLAILVRTCRRFRALASNLLLRDLRWKNMESTYRNLEAWAGVYSTVTMLPRKLTLGIPFDFSTYRNVFLPQDALTPEMQLFDAIYEQISRFSNLREIIFDNTMISYHAYNVVASIPTIRSVSVHNCSVYFLPSPFRDAHQTFINSGGNANAFNFPFATLPITHFSIKPTVNEHGFPAYHPLRLITAQTLESLCISWTGWVGVTYATKQWHLQNLTHLDVSMPLLTRDLVDSLVSFVANCPLRPRIKLHIERHSLSDQQIASVHFPLRGVYSYKGPLTIAACSVASWAMNPGTYRTKARDSQDHTLVEMVMTEPVEVGMLVDGLERLPKCVESLEVQVRSWDVEILFAVRHLFPGIKKLVVLYGMGEFSEDFLVTLGSSILFDLPKLHTLKLVNDKQCLVTTRPIQTIGGVPVHNPPPPPPPTGPLSSLPNQTLPSHFSFPITAHPNPTLNANANSNSNSNTHGTASGSSTAGSAPTFVQGSSSNANHRHASASTSTASVQSQFVQGSSSNPYPTNTNQSVVPPGFHPQPDGQGNYSHIVFFDPDEGEYFNGISYLDDNEDDGGSTVEEEVERAVQQYQQQHQLHVNADAGVGNGVQEGQEDGGEEEEEEMEAGMIGMANDSDSDDNGEVEVDDEEDEEHANFQFSMNSGQNSGTGAAGPSESSSSNALGHLHDSAHVFSPIQFNNTTSGGHNLTQTVIASSSSTSSTGGMGATSAQMDADTFMPFDFEDGLGYESDLEVLVEQQQTDTGVVLQRSVRRTDPSGAMGGGLGMGVDVDTRMDHGELPDYLLGWNRYCRSLRHVQLSPKVWWERRFEGDRWVQGRGKSA